MFRLLMLGFILMFNWTAVNASPLSLTPKCGCHQPGGTQCVCTEGGVGANAIENGTKKLSVSETIWVHAVCTSGQYAAWDLSIGGESIHCYRTDPLTHNPIDQTCMNYSATHGHTLHVRSITCAWQTG